jgi:hypothetical protein
LNLPRPAMATVMRTFGEKFGDLSVIFF